MTSPNLPQTLKPPDVAPPKPTYSHVSTITISGPTKIINVAGQIGADPTGYVPPSYPLQVEFALANLKRCLAVAGATTRDIVKVTHYIVNYDPTDGSRGQLYLSFMEGHTPPSTLVPVPALADPELLYEIEAMAIVAEGGGST